MLLKKIIYIILFISTFLLTGCASSFVKLAPNAVNIEDNIGVWTTYTRPRVSGSALAEVLFDLTKEKRKKVIGRLYELKLHDEIERQFILRAPSQIKATYVAIKSVDVEKGLDNKNDLVATSKKLKMDKVVIINIGMVVDDTKKDYDFIWRPKLDVSAKMLNISNGSVLWQFEFSIIGDSEFQYKNEGTSLEKSYKNLVRTAVIRMIKSML